MTNNNLSFIQQLVNWTGVALLLLVLTFTGLTVLFAVLMVIASVLLI